MHSPSAPDLASSNEAFPEPVAHTGRAMWALGIGAFAIGTGEFVIMGLLPEVATDIGVTIPQAGHLISAYALGVVIGAPVLAVLAATWGRRALLVALMLAFALNHSAFNMTNALGAWLGGLAIAAVLGWT